MMNNNLELKKLQSNVIKDILLHLPDKDKANLLICCKEWNKIITPILWEDMTSNCDYDYKEKAMGTFKKYGHYIKHLDFRNFSKWTLNPSLYPNSKKLLLPLNRYLKCIAHFKDVPLIGLYYNLVDNIRFKGSDNIEIEGYLDPNGIRIKDTLRNLKYLEIENSDDYFVKSIIPHLPSTVTFLSIGNLSRNIKTPYFNNLLNKFDNLTTLELYYIDLNFTEFNYLLSKEFPQLKKFRITEEGYSETLHEVCIGLSFYPKLETFYFRKYSILIFLGKSNLKELTLVNVLLDEAIIDKQVFPKLKLLSLSSCHNVEIKHIYKIFNMSTITFFNIILCEGSKYSELVYERPINDKPIFLSEEIYPKNDNNIITLRIENSSLRSDFFDFLYTSCPNLYDLEILNCCFESDMPFIKHEVIKGSNLTNVTFKEFKDSKLINLIDYLLVHFKNIKFVKFINLKDWNLYMKYKDDPGFSFVR